MNCPNCHKPIPARARYCIHCGAEQEATPIAAVAAAATAARGRREAANAAHAEAIPELASLATTSAAIVELPSAARARDPKEDCDPVTRPAYADAPTRRTLAISLVVACFVVGAVAAVTAWRFYAPSAITADAVATPTDDAARTPGASSATGEVAPPSAAETATETGTAENANAADVTQAHAEPPPAVAEAPQPVEITPLPPAHTAARPARPAMRAPDAPKVATAPQAAPTTTTAQPAAPATSRPPAVAMAPPVAAPVSDRWARMDLELSQCTREDFIARVVCGQRVRFRYCDGYWGKVPACPGSPAVERGQ
jgi:hypothetical protein